MYSAITSHHENIFNIHFNILPYRQYIEMFSLLKLFEWIYQCVSANLI